MDFLTKYNPANAANLEEKDIAAMRDLTDEQIQQLADAYPNQPTGNAYLVYHNAKEKDDKQRFPLGTWQNLNNLRKLGQKQFTAIGFNSKYITPKKKTATPAASRVVDLSKDQLKDAEGLKKKNEDKGNKDKPAAPAQDKKDLIVPPAGDVKTDAPITGAASQPGGEANEPTVEVKAYNDAVAELEKATAEKAHHMSIKKLTQKVADAKAAAGL